MNLTKILAHRKITKIASLKKKRLKSQRNKITYQLMEKIKIIKKSTNGKNKND